MRRTRYHGEAPRVGLVLGGGGTIGAAFHAGVLAALHHDLGWDARTAEVVVGTSAGSLVGGLLRLGVPPDDLAAMTVGGSARQSHPAVVKALAERPELPPFTLRHLLRPPRVPGPSAAAGLAGLALRRGLTGLSSLSMLLPDGAERLGPHIGFFDEALGQPWPDDVLLVCATRRRDCRRTVFGNGGRAAPLSDAVAASCAVPGYFRGVEIDGQCYVDGGVISASNADVLRRNDVDLAVIVSPMTGTAGSSRSVAAAIRRVCRRVLDSERSVLRRHGIPSVVIEPGPEVLEHMTTDFMSDEALSDILRCSFLETGAQALRDLQLSSLGEARLPAAS